MAVSLLGIIMVQYFWIRNAIAVKEKQFDRTISDALSEIVKKFDKDQNVYFVKEKIFKSDSNTTAIAYDHNKSKNNSYSFSITSDSLIWMNDKENGNIFITENDSNRAHKIAIEGGPETMISVTSGVNNEYRLETIVALDSLKKNLEEEKYIVLSELRDSVEVIFRQKVEEITSSNTEIDEVIEDMVIELKDYEKSPYPKIDSVLLKESISLVLQDKGIDQEWEYAVIQPKEENRFLIQSAGFNEKDIIQYKTRLYPKKIFQRPEMLQLIFPNKKAHIYRSVSLLMGGSMLFTLIILFTFFITIRIILRQKKLSEIKTDFINNMTHEFKTPIATISLAADSIQNKSVIEKPDRIRYFTNIIQEENKRMNSRVENVLQMSLIDKNDFNFRFEKGNVHDVILQASKNIELQLSQKKGELNLHLEAENPVMQIDKTHLLNILTNLLDNALKYSNEVPEINIRTKNKGNAFFIFVKDNGIGMDKEVHQKIFEKFFRVSKGDIHNVKGFGLGLSYVKAVILSWGGNIEVNSSPGNGSEFILEIPLIA